MKNVIIALLVVAVLVGGYLLFRPHTAIAPTPRPSTTASATPTPTRTAMRTPTPSPTPGIIVNETVVHNVSIQNFSFTPATTTVRRGDVVVFTNHDQVEHIVTSDTGVFTAGPVSSGAQWTLATASLAPGTYHYHCSIHPSMVGTIIVQ